MTGEQHIGPVTITRSVATIQCYPGYTLSLLAARRCGRRHGPFTGERGWADDCSSRSRWPCDENNSSCWQQMLQRALRDAETLDWKLPDPDTIFQINGCNSETHLQAKNTSNAVAHEQASQGCTIPESTQAIIVAPSLRGDDRSTSLSGHSISPWLCGL